MHRTVQRTKCYLVQMLVELRLRKNPEIRGKKRLYGGDGNLCQCLQSALCWESGDPDSMQRIMLKVMVMTMTMTTVISFVHTVVDSGISHSFPLFPPTVEEETVAQRK